MKKFLLTAVTMLLVLSVLSGCGKPQAEPPVTAEPTASPAESATTTPVETAPTTPSVEETPTETTTAPTVEETPAETEDDPEQESDTPAAFADVAYAEQIARYYTAISDQWDEDAYFDHEMSPMAAYYYEGNALDNIGFTFMDLDGDNSQELIIGAILNAEQHPIVFEIWTLENGEPVMLAQSGSRNRYYMQHSEEDGLWAIANEAESSAASYAVYYLHLSDGKLEVSQGILFDAIANETAPWFMTYDLDWDASNDTPIDEDTANAVMEAGRNIYIAMEYLPYSMYK